MGYSAYSDVAAGSNIVLLNGSGGATLHKAALANGITQPIYQLPVIDSGYFETSTGVGLFLNGVTNVGNINVYYLAYTP
jgi:hypothetical protein